MQADNGFVEYLNIQDTVMHMNTIEYGNKKVELVIPQKNTPPKSTQNTKSPKSSNYASEPISRFTQNTSDMIKQRTVWNNTPQYRYTAENGRYEKLKASNSADIRRAGEELLMLMEIKGNRSALQNALLFYQNIETVSSEPTDFMDSMNRYASVCGDAFERFNDSYVKYNSFYAPMPGRVNSIQKAFDECMEHQEIIAQVSEERHIPQGVLAGIVFNETSNYDFSDAIDSVRVGLFGNTPLGSAFPRLADASLGIGQVFISTASMLEEQGYMPQSQSRDEVIEKLTNDNINIYYIASILQYKARLMGFDPNSIDTLPEKDLRTIIAAYNGKDVYADEVMEYAKTFEDYRQSAAECFKQPE